MKIISELSKILCYLFWILDLRQSILDRETTVAKYQNCTKDSWQYRSSEVVMTIVFSYSAIDDFKANPGDDYCRLDGRISGILKCDESWLLYMSMWLINAVLKRIFENIAVNRGLVQGMMKLENLISDLSWHILGVICEGSSETVNSLNLDK